jgi:hypothetical protein
MATAKQLAARRKFSAIMKSGGFKKKKSTTKRKTDPRNFIGKTSGFQAANTVQKKTKSKRKSVTTKRKSTPLKRASPRKRTMVRRMRTSKTVRRRSSSMTRGIGSSLKTGMISDIIKGIGAGSLATLVVGRVAPQYAPIASIGAGFLAGGGIIGGAANLLLSGGLSSISGMFGGASTPQQEFGV